MWIQHWQPLQCICGGSRPRQSVGRNHCAEISVRARWRSVCGQFLPVAVRCIYLIYAAFLVRFLPLQVRGSIGKKCLGAVERAGKTPIKSR